MTATLSIFVSFSGDGGVERVIANLCRAFLDRGFAVDLLLVKARGAHLATVPKEVNVIRLGSTHTALCLVPLMRYLWRERPAALLAAKNRGNSVAVLARLLTRRFTRVDTRLVIRMDTHLSKALDRSSRLRKLSYYVPMRWLYPKADVIVAVSQGVADDTAQIIGVASERIRVIHNPVIAPDLLDHGAEPVAHPFLTPKSVPVIVGSGRFTRQKDFPTLLRAFARLHAHQPCRLLILGDGDPAERAKLDALAAELGISDSLSMPGFLSNPYAYIAKCDLFVLSSIWEGSPTVLTEALALGVPVVATDCPSGPREITQDGRYGRLVPMQDPQALADAMAAALADTDDSEALRAAVADYSIAASAQGHLRAMGLMA